jgi:S1-C subfamily serine protease
LRRTRTARLAAGGAALAAAALLATACSNAGTPTTHAGKSGSPKTPVSSSPVVSRQDGGGVFGKIPGIVKKIQPSVVTISHSTPQGKALGSGFVYKAGGVIVTDAHVACQEGQAAAACKGHQVKVQFPDGKTSTGTVKAADVITDLAVVKVGRDNLPAVTLDTGTPQVGQLDVVFGAPEGLSKSVSAGIVSALNRTIPASPSQGLPEGLFDLFQTDAPISPGNSGGPVVNAGGKVIGISEAYRPPQTGAVAIGFVTPASTIKTTVGQLLANGHANHPYVGIQSGNNSSRTAQLFGLDRSDGVIIGSNGAGPAVVPGSPAAKAGLKAGDIIIGLAGHKVTDETAFLRVLRQHKPGQTIKIKVDKQGSGNVKTLHITLGNRAKALNS